MASVIYKSESLASLQSKLFLREGMSISIWRPSLTSFKPPCLGYKYIYWWFAHYFGIFKNKDYSAVLVYEKKSLIGFLVLTPTYSRWEFMKNNDLQVTNVHLNSEYRGQGIAQYLLEYSINTFKAPAREFWYITSENNISSIKLCTKAGFHFVGKGIKTNKSGIKGFSKITLLSGSDL